MASGTRFAAGRQAQRWAAAPRLDSLVGAFAFIVVALLRVGVAAAIVAGCGGVDATWTWIRSLPPLIEPVAWLLVLPVVAALWYLPVAARLVVIAALAGIVGWAVYGVLRAASSRTTILHRHPLRRTGEARA